MWEGVSSDRPGPDSFYFIKTHLTYNNLNTHRVILACMYGVNVELQAPDSLFLQTKVTQ